VYTGTRIRHIAGIEGARQVGAGSASACAVVADGTVRCWMPSGEESTNGELGDGPGRHGGVRTVVGLHDVVAIDVGDQAACALQVDRSLWCWGRHPARSDQRDDHGDDTAVRIDLPPVRSFSLGLVAACAALVDGGVRCWGQSNVGLGDGVHTTSRTPVGVLGLRDAIDVDAADPFCAVTRAGDVLCWGDDYNAPGHPTPSPIPGPKARTS
jgi:hypothetical protein